MPEGTGGARRLTRLTLVAGAVAAAACTVAPGQLLGQLLGQPALAAASVEPTSMPAVSGPVVLIGTSGIRWSDVDAGTPALLSLTRDGAIGALAVRSIRSYACPADGWLAISSGRLAAAPPTTASVATCDPIPEASEGNPVPGWLAAKERAEEDGRGAVLGSFGHTLLANQREVAALGPGAAIAITGSEGIPVGSVEPLSPEPELLEAQVADAAEVADLVVVDVGGVRAAAESGVARTEQIRLVDDRIDAVLRGLPPTATVLVASIADDGQTPHLQVLGATGPAIDGTYADALLGSRSTRQPGLVQTTDLAPTVLSLLGVPNPDVFVGSPITPSDHGELTPAERLRAVNDLDDAAQAISPYTIWFFGGLVVLQALVYGAALVGLRRTGPTGEGRARVLTWLRRVCLVFSCVPVATYLANLVPWWRFTASFAVLVFTVGVIAVAIAAVAITGPWRQRLLGPLGFVGGITAGVLAVDVITGSRLMISSLMGLQPLVAGRFYGLGNVAFAIFGTGALLLATGVADAFVRAGRRALALVGVIVIGTITIVIDGAPGLGSDFGGPLALIPAFAVLVVLVGRLRSSWRLAVGIGLAAMAVVIGLALLDWMRPADERTHLGRFVEAVTNGEAWQVVGRKLEQNVDLLLGSFAGPLVLVVAGFLGVAVLRPGLLRLPALPEAYERAPALRPGLLGILVLIALGFALNDSGAAVPAVAAAIAGPLIVATAATLAADRAAGAGRAQLGSAPAQPVPPGR